MGDLVTLDTITTVDEPAEQVLEKAKSWNLETVVILGLTEDNELITGGNKSDKPLINIILDWAKQELLEP